MEPSPSAGTVFNRHLHHPRVKKRLGIQERARRQTHMHTRTHIPTCKYEGIHVHMHKCTRQWTHTMIHAHLLIRAIFNMFMFICMYVNTNAHTRALTHVYVYEYIHMNIYIHANTFTHAHTHTHARTHKHYHKLKQTHKHEHVHTQTQVYDIAMLTYSQT